MRRTLFSIVIVAAAAAIVYSLPDIARYLRLREM